MEISECGVEEGGRMLPSVGTPVLSRLDAEHHIAVGEDSRDRVNCNQIRIRRIVDGGETHPLRIGPCREERRLA